MINAAQERSPVDEALVQALLRDLDTGFGELFQTYQHVVFSIALRMCGRWADAEDIAAEAFLRAYRAVSRYDRGRLLALQPRSWLLTIAINLYRNQQRTAARQPPPAPLDPATELRDGATDVEATWLQRETGRELSALLALLPDDQRAAVVLRHMIDLPPTEIAQILGRPLGTVKSDISRALTRLRALHTAALARSPNNPLEATA